MDYVENVHESVKIFSANHYQYTIICYIKYKANVLCAWIMTAFVVLAELYLLLNSTNWMCRFTMVYS